MYIFHIWKLKLKVVNKAWSTITIEEEILDQGLKKIILEEGMALQAQIIVAALATMGMLILIETAQWQTHTMLKKLYKNFNN